MGRGRSIGLCGTPLLFPLLSTTNNQPEDEALAHQAFAEVIPDPPFSLLGEGEQGSGGLVGKEKEQGDHRMD